MARMLSMPLPEVDHDSPPKIVIERHAEGYVAYPLGLARGAVVGQGDSYEADVRSALVFHAETFGPDALAPSDDDR